MKKINNFKNVDDDVFFGVYFSLCDRVGVIYVGSLFCGSGFWVICVVFFGDYFI